MYSHDVLIIGAGLAGMRAALSAAENGADVAVISKVHPVRSHSNAAQGGINAALEHAGTTGTTTHTTRSRAPTISETRTPSRSCVVRPVPK